MSFERSSVDDVDTVVFAGNQQPDIYLSRQESPSEVPKYESCCFKLDRQFVIFVVQTIIGLFVLSFCGWQLASIEDCNRATPYWGLMGTITGFFFRKLSIKG